MGHRLLGETESLKDKTYTMKHKYRTNVLYFLFIRVIYFCFVMCYLTSLGTRFDTHFLSE